MLRAKGETPRHKINRLDPDPGMADSNGTAPSPMQETPERQRGSQIKNKGVGDYAQFGERYNKYWDVMEKNKRFSPQSPVIKPPIDIPPEKQIEFQYFAQLLKEVLSCGVYFTKNPNWMEPPIESTIFDQVTPAVGTVIAAGPGGAFRTILTQTVPDRFVKVVAKFGNALEAPGAFGAVEFRIRVNNRPAFIEEQGLGLPPGSFTSQLGQPIDPTLFCMPIIVYGNQTLTLDARSLDANPHTVFARWCGWEYPVRTLTNDGSYGDFHQV